MKSADFEDLIENFILKSKNKGIESVESKSSILPFLFVTFIFIGYVIFCLYTIIRLV